MAERVEKKYEWTPARISLTIDEGNQNQCNYKMNKYKKSIIFNKLYATFQISFIRSSHQKLLAVFQQQNTL